MAAVRVVLVLLALLRRVGDCVGRAVLVVVLGVVVALLCAPRLVKHPLLMYVVAVGAHFPPALA